MAQWIRAPATLAEDLGSVPSTYMIATTVCMFRESDSFFMPPLAMHTGAADMHKGKIHIHRK